MNVLIAGINGAAGYIYKTINQINGRIYIGKRQGEFDCDYLGSGLAIKRAIRKYGKENFKIRILAYATNGILLSALEIKYISKYRSIFGNAFLYNICDGGQGHTAKHSQKTKEELSKLRIGKSPWNKGLKGAQVAWNKGLNKDMDLRVAKYANKITGGKFQRGIKHEKTCMCQWCYHPAELSPMFGKNHKPESLIKMSEVKKLRNAERKAFSG